MKKFLMEIWILCFAFLLSVNAKENIVYLESEPVMKEENYKEVENPQTGEDFPMGILAFSSLGAIVLYKVTKKNKIYQI